MDQQEGLQERKAAAKVAIVGGGGSRLRAPFRDRSWEIWGFSSREGRLPRLDRWFEIHALPDLRQQLATRKPGRRTFAGYMRFMRRLKCPVYMQEPVRSIPMSTRFPKDQLVRRFGRCFTSTASFLIALAIMEGYGTIGLWGIDLKGKEYRRQRPAVLYLLALARRRGIRLVVPPSLARRVPARPRFVGTRVLYAYDWRSPHAWWRERVWKRLRRERRKARRKARLKTRRRGRR